jgi:hypothetical protein
MEDRMKMRIGVTIILLATMFPILPTIGHGGATMEGTYTNNGGMVTLDLKSGVRPSLP